LLARISATENRIHPTAVIHPRAEVHETVTVGAHAVIGEHVTLGAHTVVMPNVVIDGWTTIGERNQIFPGAVIGMDPQDRKYKGGVSRVILGHDNIIRECVTINRATGEEEATVIGNGNLLMAYVHVAHNCLLGNQIVIANAVALAGHVVIESCATLGGLVGVHQFTHIGERAMVGGMSRIDRDVPPFMLAEGHPGRIRGLNLVGLKRAGWKAGSPDFASLKDAYRLLYRSALPLEKALEQLKQHPGSPSLTHLIQFLESSLRDPQRRGPLPGQLSASKIESHDTDVE